MTSGAAAGTRLPPAATAAGSATLESVLRTRGVVVCAGPGGVGKTTVSAALALAAARRGRRACVCTIDPAKRLANSLGIEELGGAEKQVDPERLRAAGIELAPGGSLHALMLDTKGTFDQLVNRYAPSPEVAGRILENHFYRKITGQVAGSQEYAASEKLYELHGSGRYDLIVLDTPPTKHAIDFLKAPKRLTDFLDGSVLQWFVMPYFKAGGWGLGIAQRMATKVLEWLDELFGLRFLQELNEFFQVFQSLYGGFKERAEKVNELLRRRDLVAFVLVTSPARDTVAETVFFEEELRTLGLPVGGAVANRVHTDFLGEGGLGDGPLVRAAASEGALVDLQTAIARAVPDDACLQSALLKAVENFYDFELLARADREHLRALEARLRAGGSFIREIPAFERDVYDLPGLARLENWLLEDAAASTRGGGRSAAGDEAAA